MKYSPSGCFPFETVHNHSCLLTENEEEEEEEEEEVNPNRVLGPVLGTNRKLSKRPGGKPCRDTR